MPPNTDDKTTKPFIDIHSGEPLDLETIVNYIILEAKAKSLPHDLINSLNRTLKAETLETLIFCLLNPLFNGTHGELFLMSARFLSDNIIESELTDSDLSEGVELRRLMVLSEEDYSQGFLAFFANILNQETKLMHIAKIIDDEITKKVNSPFEIDYAKKGLRALIVLCKQYHPYLSRLYGQFQVQAKSKGRVI